MMTPHWITHCITVGFMLLVGCEPSGSPSSGTGSQTPNPSVAGTLQLADGTPAPNVSVKIFVRSLTTDRTDDVSNMERACDSTVTDDSGYFNFTGIDTGLYLIEGDGGAFGMAVIDSVSIESKQATILPPAPLKKPGSITGEVHLSEGGAPKQCFILVVDLGRYTETDTSGKFILNRLAQGSYHLRFVTTEEGFGILDVPDVKVAAGDTTSLGDTLKLPFLSLPAPKGLRASYDTLHGVVHLSWQPVIYPGFQRYMVYKNNTGSPTVSQRIVTDTSFTDTIFRNSLDTVAKTIEYSIKSIDSGYNLSKYYSSVVQIQAPSPAVMQTKFSFRSFGTRKQFCVEPKDTIGIAVSFDNKVTINDSIEVWLDSARVNIFRHSSAAGEDTLLLSWTDFGEHVLTAKAFDAAQGIWTSSVLTLRVKHIWEMVSESAPGIPARTGYPVGVHNDTLWLTGGYGASAANSSSYEFKSDVYFSADAKSWNLVPTAVYFTPRADHSFLSFLGKMWVTGGHNREAFDLWSSSDGITWKVHVPFKSSGARYVVFDEKMWKIGGTHDDPNIPTDVSYTEDGDNWIITPPYIRFSERTGMAVVVFKQKIWVIAGSGGQQSNDIWYSEDGLTWTQAVSQTTFSSRYGHSVVEFNGELWLIGGYDNDNKCYQSDIWHSPDGVTWTLADKNAEFTPRGKHSAFVFDGTLYVCGGETAKGQKMDIWRMFK